MNDLRFTSAVELTAAPGDGSKLPTFAIHGYTGAPMRVDGFSYPVIVDLTGMTTEHATVPALLHHDSTQIVGQGEVKIDASGVHITGTVTGGADDPAARTVTNHSKNGFQWRASIGATPLRREMLDAGTSAVVNGRQVQGPMIIVRASVLREISFVPIGADNQTSATVAAKKGQTMSTDLNTDTTDVIASERDRIRAIGTLHARFLKDSPDAAGRFEPIFAAAMEGDMTPDAFELEMLRASRHPATPAIRGVRPQAGYGSGGTADRDLLEAALLAKVGKDDLAATHFGDQVASAGRTMKTKSMTELFAFALRSGHHDVPDSRSELIRAGFSYLNIPTALSNVTGKLLMESYNESPATWRSFAKVLPAANFKDQVGVRPSNFPNLEELGSAGEVKHGVMSELTYPWKISTFAKQFKISRKDVVNDDLSFLQQLPQLMAKSALRSVSDLVWTLILANTGSFFSSGNNNLIDAAGSALSLASLQTLATMMRTQRNAVGDDLDIMPKTLIVPPELESDARAILNSQLLGKTDGSPTGNPLQSLVSLETEPRISNTDKFSGADDAKFFLFASPQDAPFIVGFLDGRETPTVEFFGLDHDIDHLAIAFRCVHDYGCAFGDFRAAARSDGTPSEG